jgi:hypothetical protein
MMSIANYQSLQSASEMDCKTLGVTLPKLTQGALSISRQLINTEAMINAVKGLNPITGWAMYRNQLIVSPQISDRNDLIEAEYSDGENSLMIKLVGHDRYSVCLMENKKEEDGSMVYKMQSMHTKIELTNKELIQYRLWYKQSNSEENKGRWEPFAQQFIGFTAQEER